jgi:hypothetical protein
MSRLASFHLGAHDSENIDENCNICALGRGDMTWREFAKWLESLGFKQVKRGHNYLVVEAVGDVHVFNGWQVMSDTAWRLFRVLSGKSIEHRAASLYRAAVAGNGSPL